MWPQYLTISLAPTRPGRQLNALETGLRFITNLGRTDKPERGASGTQGIPGTTLAVED
jgi:hypothetical protein